MLNILKYTAKTYVANIYLILLSSLSFIIAFLVPLFASFPTYNDMGGVFLRTGSIFLNLNPFNTAIIVIAALFSLLFLSFAIVAINIVVKHSRTQTRIRSEVIRGLEKYTGMVFMVLLLFTFIIAIVDALTFSTGYSGIITAVVALLLTPFFFYTPSSIVVDDCKLGKAFGSGLKFFRKRPDYFVAWMAIAIILITLFDFIFIAVAGTIISRYAMLVFSSVFILPFLVLLQGELYVSRFKLLK